MTKNIFIVLLQIVYTTVCLNDTPSEPSDFFPLSVNYQERFSAAGRTRYVLHILSIILFVFSDFQLCFVVEVSSNEKEKQRITRYYFGFFLNSPIQLKLSIFHGRVFLVSI